MLKFINFKEGNPSVDYALAVVEIEIENAKLEGVTCIKVLHGYGSHGQGGVILNALRRQLQIFKKQKKIADFFAGDEWNIFSPRTMEILNADKSIVGDEDLNKVNPGITIIRV